jgi:hypothetical protein
VSAGRAETMKLVKALRKQGFEVVRTGSGHWKVTNPGRDQFVIMGFSSASSGQKKTLKRLQEIGYRP